MLSSNGGSKQGNAVAKSFLFLVQREKIRKYCLLCSLRSLNVTDQAYLAAFPNGAAIILKIGKMLFAKPLFV